jgi:hypothetical protein
MQIDQQTQSIDYAEAIAVLVATLPPERAGQVYDFVRFLQSQIATPTTDSVETGWLNDTEAQMQAEDALWSASQVRHSARFAALTAAARAEIKAGVTQPMFTDDEALALP